MLVNKIEIAEYLSGCDPLTENEIKRLTSNAIKNKDYVLFVLAKYKEERDK